MTQVNGLEAFSLAGRVAVVTGAASGIGRQSALALAGAGARLVLTDHNEDGLAEVVERIGDAAEACPANVAVRDDVERVANFALERHGRIEIWANVAGMAKACPLLDLTEELVANTVAVNQNGVLWGSIAAARAMKAQGGGSIVNISSTGGTTAPPGQSIYAMTKAAVNSLTRCLATELGPFGIRANTISPGWIDTPLAGSMYRNADGSTDPEKREQFLTMMRGTSPLRLTGEPSDIANAVLYLASDASRFVTGQNLFVNGGVYMN